MQVKRHLGLDKHFLCKDRYAQGKEIKMKALPSNSEALLERIKLESTKFRESLSRREIFALRDWQGNAHDLVNRRLQGLSFSEMRTLENQGKLKSHIPDFDVFLNEDMHSSDGWGGISWPFRSASMEVWDQTTFWQQMSKEQQDFLRSWIYDRSYYSEKFEKLLPLVDRLFGHEFVKTQYEIRPEYYDEEEGIREPREFVVKGPEEFLLYYYKHIQRKELLGHFAIFTYSQMDQILDNAVREYTNLFSKGITVDEKVYLYRGLRTRFDKRIQFQSTTLLKQKLDLFCFHSEQCGSVVFYNILPGTPFFMIDEWEDEVVLSWNLGFLKLADPEPIALFTDKEHDEIMLPGVERIVFMTYKYMVFLPLSVSGGLRRLKRSKSKRKSKGRKSNRRRNNRK